MKIILLRHGETIWNKERRLQGCCDIPLSQTGIDQIYQVGQHLAKAGIHPDLILSSPLQRARKSAEIIAETLLFPVESIVNEPLFLERNFGICEGLSYDSLSQYPDDTCPGMESLKDLLFRAQQALTHCMQNYPGKTVLIASHGSIIKAILVAASRGSIGYFDKDVWIENGSCCILETKEGDWTISFF